MAPTLSGNTLEGWVDAVQGALVSEPEPVILVGHSRGGVIISAAAERLPEKVAALVYLAAFLLRPGESVLRALREEGNSPFLQHAKLAPDRGEWILDEKEIRGLLYGDCSDVDAAFAQAMLVPEPAVPMMTPLRISEERFGRVRRIYIETLRDRAIPLALQRRMHADSPCSRVLSLDSDHSPFLSAPRELSSLLMDLDS